MHENLLSPTNIMLFGRVFPLNIENIAGTLGGNRFLRAQLVADGATFARIYAISYEGAFYHLSKPAVFLVHGEGRVIRDAGLPARGGDAGGLADDSGLITKDFTFERSSGRVPPEGGGPPEDEDPDLGNGEAVRYWEYDKGDFSLRLDITSGTFEDILLEAEVDAQLQMSSAARMQTAGTARMQISHAARMQVSRRGGG